MDRSNMETSSASAIRTSASLRGALAGIALFLPSTLGDSFGPMGAAIGGFLLGIVLSVLWSRACGHTRRAILTTTVTAAPVVAYGAYLYASGRYWQETAAFAVYAVLFVAMHVAAPLPTCRLTSTALTMRWVCRVPALCVLIASASETATAATVPDSVWTWSASCERPQSFRLEIQLDGRLLAASKLPVCRVPATHAIARSNAQRFHFIFHARHTFQRKYQTTLADTITADVWQAGADPKGVILGISFSTTRQVLLNTVHILDPHQRRRYVLDTGMASTSYPAPPRQNQSRPHTVAPWPPRGIRILWRTCGHMAGCGSILRRLMGHAIHWRDSRFARGTPVSGRLARCEWCARAAELPSCRRPVR